ncbi:MAG: hypothetical protein ABJA57_03665 [Ginsengibacter sp.]
MEHSVHILDELKQISPFLSDMKKINVFSVPQGYFSNLDRRILENIFNQPNLLLTSEHHNLGVPEGYFENLPGNILSKIKSLQTEGSDSEHFPLLQSLKNDHVFDVPDQYFHQLPAAIMARIDPQRSRVTGLKRKTLWNYAVAASITGLMAISSLLVVDKNPSLPGNQVAGRSSVPAIQASYQYKTEEQIMEGITTLSNDDIIKYLETTGSDADNEALASGVTEQGLPEQTDYLQNEKTLDAYLNQN